MSGSAYGAFSKELSHQSRSCLCELVPQCADYLRHAHNKTQEVLNTIVSEKVNRVLHDHVSRLTANDFYDKQFSILDSTQLGPISFSLSMKLLNIHSIHFQFGFSVQNIMMQNINIHHTHHSRNW